MHWSWEQFEDTPVEVVEFLIKKVTDEEAKRDAERRNAEARARRNR
jgi:hypothetical protein